MTDFVFLGPSLPREEALALHEAEYLDPVAMGDLYALVRGRARPGDRVAIIDGLFEQVPAVWHKEVLFAIESGVHVYGASSMGALRAAELHPFGMRGVGRIFEAYRDGTIEDDDEVVVAHATSDRGYRSLSHAMISLRFGLARLRQEGLISEAERSHLTSRAKAEHYSARSWASVYAEARASGFGQDVLAALRKMARNYDAKADDARALLELLRSESDREVVPAQADFVLERTSFWISLCQSQQARLAATGPGGDFHAGEAQLLAQVRAVNRDRAAILAESALLRMASEHSRDWEPDQKELTAAAFRLAVRHGLRTSDDLRAWRQRQGLESHAAWRDLLELQSREHMLVHHLLPGSDRFMLAALKGSGRYETASVEFGSVRDRFGTNRTSLSLEDSGVTPEALQQWYEARCGRMHPDPEAHSARLGFETLRDFIAEILVAYLAERNQAELAATG